MANLTNEEIILAFKKASISISKREVIGCYGSKMLQRFSFKPDPIYTGVKI